MVQAFSAVRPAVFQTECEGQSFFGTHGGCSVVVKLDNRVFVIIPKHCVGDYDPTDLVVPEDQLYGHIGVKPHVAMTFEGIEESAKQLDIEDIVVLAWHEEVPLNFGANILDISDYRAISTVPGDQLAIFGIPKNLMTINDETTSVVYNFYDAIDFDYSPHAELSFMRVARGVIPEGPNETTGFSGGLVWNRSRNCLAGLTLRGGKSDREIIFHYIPFQTVYRLVAYTQFQLVGRKLIPAPTEDWLATAKSQQKWNDIA